MEVGSTLEEALQLQQEHDQLLSKLQVSFNISLVIKMYKKAANQNFSVSTDW